MPACLPEQLCCSGVGSAPHSSSSSPAGAFASRLRTAASCSGDARWDADAIAISSVVRSSRARTSGSAWNGFAEERRYATRCASPACSMTAPSRTATACTTVRRLDDVPAPHDHPDLVHARQRMPRRVANAFWMGRALRIDTCAAATAAPGEGVTVDQHSTGVGRRSARLLLVSSRRRTRRSAPGRTRRRRSTDGRLREPDEQHLRQAARVRDARGRPRAPGRAPGDRRRERRHARRRDAGLHRERRLRGQDAQGGRLDGRDRPVRLHRRAADPAADAGATRDARVGRCDGQRPRER